MLNLPATERLRRTALIIWSIVGAIALAYVMLRIADSVRIIWLPLAFAGGFVLLLNPAVNGLQRRGVPRSIGTFIAFLVLVGLVVASGFLFIPVIQEQAAEFATSLPTIYETVVEWLDNVGANLGIELLTMEGIQEWVQDPANQEAIQQVLGNFGAVTGGLIRGVAETVAVIVLAPVLALYMLIQLPRSQGLAVELTPPRHRDEVVYVGRQLSTALGSFVRGQLLVAFIVGMASSIGLYLIDLPFWLIIGILSGVLNLVPFAGPVIGGALAGLVALLTGDLPKALLAVTIFTLIQQVDNHVITPLVQRTRVNLSPLVIVLALIVGGSLAGLLGVLVAVPATATVRILAGHLWRTRILGQSWEEASQRMIEVTPPPERIVGIRRRPPATGHQQRLFDTADHPSIGRHVIAEGNTPAAGATGERVEEAFDQPSSSR
jgi:predicted PurR-regulated permease PerM